LHQNHVFAIRPNGHLTPEWLAMFTQSSRARSYFFLNSKQSTNLASISSSNVMNLDLPMPSVDEQERILQFLESELQQFTDLQKQADKGIQLLLERRSALVSAAVTGKIDVRNWQPPVDESAFDEEVRQAGMEATV
jgi:type I restriction enzyme S subunit